MKAYSVARRAFFLGKWIRHCGWYPGRVPRLFQKEYASFSSSAVHEGLEVRGSVGELQNDLLHFTDPNLFHYFSKFNRYTSLASGDLLRAGRGFRISDLLLHPPWLFFKMYILRLGFLDGIPGLILALLSSAYSLYQICEAVGSLGVRKSSSHFSESLVAFRPAFESVR